MIALRQTIRKISQAPPTPFVRRSCATKTTTTPKLADVSASTAIPCGSLAGTLGALCGVGGGLVIIPVLKQFSKLTVHQITATSLFSITIASSVGAASYIAQGKARVPEAGLIALSAMATAGLGATVSQRMPAASLTKLLGLTMMLSVPAVLLKSPSSQATEQTNDDNTNTNTTKDPDDKAVPSTLSFYLGKSAPRSMPEVSPWFQKNWGFLGLGLFVGFSSSLLGIGGGIVMTTYMSVATDLSQHEAVATSLVAMVPTGLSATFWHMRAGNVQTKAACMIGGACAVTMYGAATYIAPHVSDPTMRKIFAAVLGLASLKMLV
jgi:uncharacterized membrane protein YfcA